MRKQKRRGLAILLAIVMLVSLLYVPGSSLHAYAEGDGIGNVETVSEPIQETVVMDPPVQIQKVIEDEKPEPPAELPAITEEDEQRFEADPDSLDSVEAQNSQRTVGIMSGNELGLSPAGGDFYNGEAVTVSVLNAQDWHYSYQINGGQWKWALKTDTILIKNDATVKVADLRVRFTSRVPFFEFYTVTAQQTYQFDDPAQPTGLDLKSRTLSELNLVWDKSSDENVDHYNVYVWSEGADKEKVDEAMAELMAKPHKPEFPKGKWLKVSEVTDASYTFTGMNRGETLKVGVSAVCKGHVDDKVLFESPLTDGTYRTADFEVTTKITPAAAGSVAPSVSYWDLGDSMEATAELNEGYEVKRWIVKKLPMNPVARVLGFGETETIEAETVDVDEDEDVPGETDTFEVVVKSDMLITAKAGLKVFTVTVDPRPMEQGTVTATIESGKQLKKPNRYEYGTVLVLESSAADGYDHDKWVANGQKIDETDGVAKYTVTGDASIIGTFMKEPVGLELLRIQELNNGEAIHFSKDFSETKELVSDGGKKKFGEVTHKNLTELTQEVPYGTTLKQLVYNATVKNLSNNLTSIKTGDKVYVDLPTYGITGNPEAEGAELTISNHHHLVIDTPKGLDNSDLDAALVDGQYKIEFRVIHKMDERFVEEDKALDGVSKDRYTNEVHRYVMTVDIDVLPPALELAVGEGGQVHVVEMKGLKPLSEELAAASLTMDKFRLIDEWVEGETEDSVKFFSNPKRQITLTPEVYNEADYEFEGWYISGEEEPFSTEMVLTIPMIKNYSITAKFKKIDYIIESDSDMTQGKIMYRLLNDEKKKGSSTGWAELPVTIHYGDSVELKAVPYTSWLFNEWITPDFKKGDTDAAAKDLVFKQRDIVNFRLNERGLEQFEQRVMVASAEFMSDYGFTEYHVAGINDGADLMIKQDAGTVDKLSVISKAGIITYDYHVPYGTSLQDAMDNAAFAVTYGVANESNVVKLYGESLGTVSDATGAPSYSEVVQSPHTVKITETFNPFKAVDENQFMYRYAVQQYPDASQEGMLTKKERPEINRDKEYRVIVTVIVDDPLLTVEVPAGGYVDMTVDEMEEPPLPAALETETTPQATEKLLPGYHKKSLELGSQVKVTPVADEGYRFSGWTTTAGYTVPNEGVVVMDGNYKIKPIFTAVQTDRRRNHNNNTPEQQIEQILDESTPLGILYRQLFIGYPNGDLRMFDSINRAQLSLILQRAQQYDVSNPPVIPVADVMEEWYRKEALAAVGKGYMSLRSGNIFAGHDAVTGAELVQALNKAFGANLTLEEAYRLANGVTSEQVAKIMMTNATDFQLTMSGIVPLGVGSFDANKPVARETVARMIYAVLYPQAEAAPALTPQ